MQNPARALARHLTSVTVWRCVFYSEAAAILILSAIPSVGDGINGGTMAHLLAYSVLSFTGCFLMIARKVPFALAKGAFAALLFGCFVELLQNFIPYRSCELNDVAANSIGSLAGMAAAGMSKNFF